ncbi:RecD-like DNA helicase YrrC [Clostridiaceae bacterium JG1575]|nr:RecD-like DNA helicase YrrC [Clostridiaceae bacterium JG1575]
MEELDIKGTVKDIIYRNEETGYVVARVKGAGTVLTFTGTLPWVYEGMLVALEGEMVEHKSFGPQLKVEKAEEIRPETKEGLERYLSSGVLAGIGPALAKRLVAYFGLELFEVMDEDITRLKEVEGIGEKKLERIAQSYERSREVRTIMVFLQSYGVTPRQCMKIYNRYGQAAIGRVRENPYVLCEDIPSFGFRTADRIAMNLGIEKDSPFRIESGLHYTVAAFGGAGNTCMPLTALLKEAGKLLEVEEASILTALRHMILQDSLKVEEIDGEQCAFIGSYWHSEVQIAEHLLLGGRQVFPRLKVNPEQFFERYEKEHHLTLHPQQKKAILSVVEEGMVVITGGPGTGKTTIIKAILTLLERSNQKVLMAAPTGRAAKRMSEATGGEAKTIHRMLSLGMSEEGIDDQEGDLLEADCVIIDEASMIDVLLMKHLVSSLKQSTRLVLVGDADQLPSVGPGRVLSDIMEGGACPVVRLERIYRQGKESMITVNAHRINHGEAPLMNARAGDFFFLETPDAPATVDCLIGLVQERLPKFHQEWDPLRDIQVLSPMRKGDLGIHALNEHLKGVLNPKGASAGFTEFRIGDKVMQNRNNYQLKSRNTLEAIPGIEAEETGVFNGDVGYVASLAKEDQIVTVQYEDRYVDYGVGDLDDLELAYAITIHKSQGSEFPVVLLPVFMGPPLLMNRNLLYTAVTRARALVVLIGSSRALRFMVANDRSFQRHTSLGWRLRRAQEGFPHQEPPRDGLQKEAFLDPEREELP